LQIVVTLKYRYFLHVYLESCSFLKAEISLFLSGAANAHTRLNDLAINDALRIVNGCLRPTPADNLPILAGIQPAELRRKGAALSLARHAMEPEHLLHSAVTCPPSANTQRL